MSDIISQKGCFCNEKDFCSDFFNRGRKPHRFFDRSEVLAKNNNFCLFYLGNNKKYDIIFTNLFDGSGKYDINNTNWDENA